MAEDSRKGREVVSSRTTISSGSGSAQDLLDIRDEENVSIDFIKIEYSSTATSEEELGMYDEPAGTGAGNLSEFIDKFFVNPGDVLVIEEPTYEDVTSDIVLNPDGNSDGDIYVTVGTVKVAG